MSKHLYLTSSVEIPGIASDIRRKIGGDKTLKIPFIKTPAEAPSEVHDLSWLDGERKMLNKSGFSIFDYTITDKSSDQIRVELADIDALYVSGGNELYLKQEANKCGFGDYVKEFIKTGKPYIASSGGSMIMGTDLSPVLAPDELSDLEDPDHPDLSGFGIVNFTILPHWGSEEFRDEHLHNRIVHMYDSPTPFILLNNNQYVEVVDDVFKIVDITKQ